MAKTRLRTLTKSIVPLFVIQAYERHLGNLLNGRFCNKSIDSKMKWRVRERDEKRRKPVCGSNNNWQWNNIVAIATNMRSTESKPSQCTNNKLIKKSPSPYVPEYTLALFSFLFWLAFLIYSNVFIYLLWKCSSECFSTIAPYAEWTKRQPVNKHKRVLFNRIALDVINFYIIIVDSKKIRYLWNGADSWIWE